MCMFDPSNSICLKKCSLILNRAECQQYPDMCTFTNSKCAPVCVLRYTSQEACDSDAGCMWDPSMGKCRATCRESTSVDYCNSDRMCRWQIDNGACEKRCSAIAARAECVSATSCDFSPFTQQCNENCAYRFTTSTTCNTQDCLWNSASMKCDLDCERISVADSCSARKECQWDPSQQCNVRKAVRQACGSTNMTQEQCTAAGCCWEASSGAWCFHSAPSCSRRCSLKYAAQLDCNADATCEWDSERTMCSRKCSLAQSALACGTLAMCEWNARCEKKCVYEYTSRQPCDDAPLCRWNNATSKCENDCAWYNGELNITIRRQMCESDIVCRMDTSNNCRPKCEEEYTTKAACVTDSTCLWDGRKCRTECGQFKSQALCDTMSDVCDWDEHVNECQQLCTIRTTDASCKQDPECSWVDEACKVSCDQLSDSTSCYARGDCSWDTEDAKCYVICKNRRNDTECAKWDNCVYHYTTKSDGTPYGCMFACENEFKTESPCNGNDWCEWNPKDKICERSCTKYTQIEYPSLFNEGVAVGAQKLAAKCDDLSLCVWAVNNSIPNLKGTCVTDCVFRASSEVQCAQYKDCMWNGQSGQCPNDLRRTRQCLLPRQSDVQMGSRRT